MTKRDNVRVPPETGFVRLQTIVGRNGIISVSRSTWYADIKEGHYPKPVRLGPRISAWGVSDIRAKIAQGE